MYRPTGGHLNPQSSHRPHGLTLLADQSSLTRLIRASLPPRLLCSLRSPPAYRLPLLLSLRSRLICLLPSPCLLLASLALPAVCFARRLSLPLLALLAASPALPGASLKGRLFCMLAMLAASPTALALIVSSPACCSLRSLPQLPLALLAAGCWPLRLQLASAVARTCWFCSPPDSPCPPRLLLISARAPDPLACPNPLVSRSVSIDSY